MADYETSTIDGFAYDTPVSVKPRKKKPPFIVVMNENCTCCAGSPACLPECPVDCIHRMYEDGRPVRVYVDNDICIGCMNCFSDHYRPKSIMKGDQAANCTDLNRKDEMTKAAICPWDAIEVLPFDAGAERSKLFYGQPRELETADSDGSNES